jgi:hypothetical protein
MFRATLAVRLPNKGASLEEVAALLGNSVASFEALRALSEVRQEVLEEAVRRTLSPENGEHNG